MKGDRTKEIREKLSSESKAAKACGKYAAAVMDSLLKALEVYRMAAGHYFPGAEVEFHMNIKVNPYGGAVEADKPTVNKRINLLDLM